MTKVFYSPGALADIERLAEFLLANDPHAAAETGRILMEAIAMLTTHPCWDALLKAACGNS